MNTVNMDPAEYQMGKSKVFIKTPESVCEIEKKKKLKYPIALMTMHTIFNSNISSFCWKK